MKRVVGWICLAFLLFSCSKSDSPVPAVTIIDFEPKTGPTGTSVTISGTGFSTTASENQVLFKSVPAEVTSASSSSLVVTVPYGDITGWISVTAGGQVASSNGPFQGYPEIVDFEPKSGKAETEVVISGFGFSNNPNIPNIVTFNGIEATVIAVGVTTPQLIVRVPSGDVAGPVSVEVNDIVSTHPEEFKMVCFLLSVDTDVSYFPQPQHIEYEVNFNGQVTKATITGHAASVTTYSYDLARRIVSSAYTTGGPTTTSTYTYDTNNRVIARTTGSTVQNYIYNSTGQLIRISLNASNYTEYAYPNTTTMNFSSETMVNGASTTITTFEYDDKKNGARHLFSSFNFIPENNATRQVQGSFEVINTYTYNSDGYPVSSVISGDATGTRTYTYDCN